MIATRKGTKGGLQVGRNALLKHFTVEVKCFFCIDNLEPKMQNHYYPPEYNKPGFHCPRCHVFAQQFWSRVAFGSEFVKDLTLSRCAQCKEVSVWHNTRL